VTRWYRDHGYQFLVLSDHNVLVNIEALSGAFAVPEQFLLVPGEEVTDTFETKQLHINGLNVARLVEPRHGTSVLDTLQRNVDAIRGARRAAREPPNFGWAIAPGDLAALDRYNCSRSSTAIAREQPRRRRRPDGSGCGTGCCAPAAASIASPWTTRTISSVRGTRWRRSPGGLGGGARAPARSGGARSRRSKRALLRLDRHRPRRLHGRCHRHQRACAAGQTRCLTLIDATGEVQTTDGPEAHFTLTGRRGFARAHRRFERRAGLDPAHLSRRPALNGRRARYTAAMQLRTARLCLDCEEVHDEYRCPVCASDEFTYISRWVPVPDTRRARARPARVPAPEIDAYREIVRGPGAARRRIRG
jgi:hypothetical protein